MSSLAGIVCTLSLLVGAFEHTGTEGTLYFPVKQVAQDGSQYMVPSCAAALPGRNALYMHSYYTRPFGIPGMKSHSIAAGFRHHAAGVRAGWHRFGIDGYTEDTCVLGAGFRPFSWLSIGAELRRYMLNMSTGIIDKRFAAWETSVSAKMDPFRRVSITLEQENLHTLLSSANTGVLYPSRHAGVSFRVFDGCNLNAQVSENFFGHSTTWSVRGVLLPMLTCSIGYSPRLESYSAGFTFAWAHMQATYSFTHHTYLGNTHAFGVTMYTGDINYTPIPPSRPSSPGRVTVPTIILDIRHCSLDELLALDIIDEKYCRRIITYRERMGPVTEKSLHQVGLSRRHISRLRPHLTGLGPAKRKVRGGNFRRISMARRRTLFRQLLGKGIPAHTSLQISEMVQRSAPADVETFITTRTGISPRLKNEIRKLCRHYMSQ